MHVLKGGLCLSIPDFFFYLEKGRQSLVIIIKSVWKNIGGVIFRRLEKKRIFFFLIFTTKIKVKNELAHADTPVYNPWTAYHCPTGEGFEYDV